MNYELSPLIWTISSKFIYGNELYLDNKCFGQEDEDQERKNKCDVEFWYFDPIRKKSTSHIGSHEKHHFDMYIINIIKKHKNTL